MSRGGKRGDGNYEVGYGRPPVQHRFSKGQSGNPSGRPKGKKKLSKRESFIQMLNRVAQREIKITVNDRPTTMTMLEAMLTRTFQQALAGKQDAVRTILSHFSEVDLWARTQEAMPDAEELARLRKDPNAAAEAYQRIMRGGWTR